MTDKVKVRTIRPHDTTEGMKAPGDEYERTAADAKRLSERGIVELAEPKAKRRK